VEPGGLSWGESITTPKGESTPTTRDGNLETIEYSTAEGREPFTEPPPLDKWSVLSECQGMCRSQFEVDSSIPPRPLNRLIGTRVQLLQVGAHSGDMVIPA
jgi:hypothetical protein